MSPINLTESEKNSIEKILQRKITEEERGNIQSILELSSADLEDIRALLQKYSVMAGKYVRYRVREATSVGKAKSFCDFVVTRGRTIEEWSMMYNDVMTKMKSGRITGEH